MAAGAPPRALEPPRFPPRAGDDGLRGVGALAGALPGDLPGDDGLPGDEGFPGDGALPGDDGLPGDEDPGADPLAG